MLKSALFVGGAAMLDACLILAQATTDMDPLTRNVSSVVSVGLSAWLVIYFITRVQPRWERRLEAREAAAASEREKFYLNAKTERDAQSTAHAHERESANATLHQLVQLTRAIHADLKAGTGCKHRGENAA